jgi:hypothetical protein
MKMVTNLFENRSFFAANEKAQGGLGLPFGFWWG